MNKFLKRLFYCPKKIVKNIPDSVFLIDKYGEIIWANAKAKEVFECNKTKITDYQFEELVDSGMAKIEQSIEMGMPVVAGAFVNDTKEIYIELNAVENRGNYIVTIRDITAITEVLERAEQACKFNKEKNAMLVKLGNEIMSPINSIIGFSQALIDDNKMDEKQDKYIKIINKSSAELLRFIEKLIEFSYAESSLYKHDYQTFDIVNTIQNIIKNTDFKDLTVEFESEELPKRIIYSDEKTLKIILQNLIETSINLTDNGSISFKITVPTEEILKRMGLNSHKPDLYMQISIVDTGAGFQQNELNDLFEPYEQMDKQGRKGMTRFLNLGTVKLLVKRLKGAVWAESEVIKGTSFNVIIPIEKGKYE